MRTTEENIKEKIKDSEYKKILEKLRDMNKQNKPKYCMIEVMFCRIDLENFYITVAHKEHDDENEDDNDDFYVKVGGDGSNFIPTIHCVHERKKFIIDCERVNRCVRIRSFEVLKGMIEDDKKICIDDLKELVCNDGMRIDRDTIEITNFLYNLDEKLPSSIHKNDILVLYGGSFDIISYQYFY